MKFLRKDIARLEDTLAECWLQFYNLDTSRLHRVFANAKRMQLPVVTLDKDDTKALATILSQANETCPWLQVTDLFVRVRQEVI